MDNTEDEGTQQAVTKDLLASGDRPSLLYFALTGSHAIQKDNMAIFMVDVLGRIVLMPPSAVDVKMKPRVPDSDLDALDESDAINILTLQGDSDEQITDYLIGRDIRTGKEEQ